MIVSSSTKEKFFDPFDITDGFCSIDFLLYGLNKILLRCILKMNEWLLKKKKKDLQNSPTLQSTNNEWKMKFLMLFFFLIQKQNAMLL